MNPRPHTQRRKARALIAATSVLGIGAVITLASWTATSYLTSSLKTGEVSGIEVSKDNSVWELPDGTGTPAKIATATFTYSSADVAALAPNQSAYVPIALRAYKGTTFTLPVSVTSSAPTISATDGHTPLGIAGTGLTYTIFTTTAFGCDATTTTTGATTLAAPLTPVIAGVGSGTVTLPAATASASGAAVYLCIKVTADTTIESNTNQDIKFAFTGGWTA
ncbi:MAG: hypothetical protein ACKOXM_00575 [Agromyces sp.]